MTEPVKPNQGAVPDPASDAATLQLLVQLLLAERQDAMAERQERARALAAKNEQRRINAEYTVADKNKSQQICTHLKGGKGLKSTIVNYAVYYHRFTDNTCYIRCQICGMKWRIADTQEHLWRGGKQVPNHTGIGWQDAVKMTTQSTNSPSASEVTTTAQPIQVDVRQLS